MKGTQKLTPELLAKIETRNASETVKLTKKLQTRRIPARMVGAVGTTYLVEWAVKDDLKRAYIPGELWHEDGVDEDVLAAGVPYGADWEAIIKIQTSPAAIAKAFRASGIWTQADFRARITDAENYLKSVTMLEVFSIMKNMEA